MDWTTEQKKVITERGKSLLVSAAAGSGKTAVLVERIIGMVCDSAKPVDVDRLLVVTFTNAAAAEMRERVLEAIEKRIEEDPDNQHLRRQEVLIHHARITTIDSFCMSVLREHFQEIGLDPAFHIGDPGELKLLEGDVMKELLEDEYAAGSEAFLNFMESFAPGRDDEKAAGLILNMVTFAQSNPRPEEWLEQVPLQAAAETPEEILGKPWMKDLLNGVKERAAGCLPAYDRAIRLCEDAGGLEVISDILEDEKKWIQRALQAEGYTALAQALSSIPFQTKPRHKKTDTYDEAVAKEAWEIRSKAKTQLTGLAARELSDSGSQMLEKQKLLFAEVSELARLASAFIRRHTEQKRRRNLVDFADLEHLALEVLCRRTEDGEEPTATALQYRDTFEEIMIDEYQDSNYVQEQILTSICRKDPPNMFMVGDVKQSIYRFRLARPELFLQKYAAYREDDEKNERIELFQNFRSRESVLDAVNFFFRRLMTEAVGGIQYTEKQSLHKGLDFEECAGHPAGGPVHFMLLDLEDQPEDADEDEESAGESGEKEDAESQPAGGMEPEAGEEEQAVGFNSREWEAAMAAARILELTDPEKGSYVWDRSLGKYRRAGFGDIVILLRSMPGWSEAYVSVLSSYGIPVQANTGTGYFSALEVRTALSFLQLVDNPLQDIPLAAVMHSPIGGFSANELGIIRAEAKAAEANRADGRKMKFYEAVCAFAAPARAAEEGQTAEAGQTGKAGNPAGTGESDRTGQTAGAGQPAEARKDLPQEDVRITELRGRAADFLKMLEKYRRMSDYLRLHELLYRMLTESGYYDYVSAMPGGAGRRANLDMLLTRAETFEQTSYRGVFQFVRYINELQKYNVDYAPESGEERRDQVRIMSIHKSKGLEFPICFVGGLGKKFNLQDLNKAVLFHPDFGAAADAIDIDARTTDSTVMKRALRRRLLTETLGEELRVLYVALTRAKEQLYLCGSKSGLWAYLSDRVEKSSDGSENLSAAALTGAGSMLDWLVDAMMPHPCFDEVYRRTGIARDNRADAEKSQISLELFTKKEIFAGQTIRRTEDAVRRKELENLDPAQVSSEALEKISERFSADYDYDDLARTHAAFTVSGLQRLAQEDAEPEEDLTPAVPEAEKTREEEPGTDWLSGKEPEAGQAPEEEPGETVFSGTLPGFLQGGKPMTAAERGSLYHWIFEHLDFEKDVKDQIDRWMIEGQISEQERLRVHVRDFTRFLKTDLGQRAAAAARRGEYHREAPFILGLTAKELFPEMRGGEEDYVSIQGVVDAWFEEDGRIILLDFKTDYIPEGKDGSLLADRYRTQLGFYKTALKRMTGREVAETWLYSVYLGEEIRVN